MDSPIGSRQHHPGNSRPIHDRLGDGWHSGPGADRCKLPSPVDSRRRELRSPPVGWGPDEGFQAQEIGGWAVLWQPGVPFCVRKVSFELLWILDFDRGAQFYDVYRAVGRPACCCEVEGIGFAVHASRLSEPLPIDLSVRQPRGIGGKKCVSSI